MKLDVTIYRYQSRKVPEAYDHKTLAVLADVHSCPFGKNNEILLEKLRAMEPKGILIPGDLLVGRHDPDFGPACRLLEQLVKIGPVYYAPGNHEERIPDYGMAAAERYQDFIREIRELGVCWLANQSVSPVQGLRIYGLAMGMSYYRRGRKAPMKDRLLDGLLGRPEKEELTVLMAHSPEYFREYAAWGADLVSAGHNHGGLVRLPLLGGVISPQYHLFPRYDAGEFR